MSIINYIINLTEPTLESAITNLNNAVDQLGVVADRAFEEVKAQDNVIEQAIRIREGAESVAERAIRVQTKLAELIA